MSATRVVLLATMLALVGAFVLVPTASAHVSLNIPVCDPMDGFCRCISIHVPTAVAHLHTQCAF